MVLDTYIQDTSIYKYTPKNRQNAAFRQAEQDKIVFYGKNTSFNLFNFIKSFFTKQQTPERWLEVGE